MLTGPAVHPITATSTVLTASCLQEATSCVCLVSLSLVPVKELMVVEEAAGSQVVELPFISAPFKTVQT